MKYLSLHIKNNMNFSAKQMATADESKLLKFVHDKDLAEKEPIAKGSFGEIFSCKWNGIRCAIKAISNLDASDSSWSLNKLKKEILLLKKLSDESRHVIKVHGLYISDNKFTGYLMEFCEFGDLRNFLNRFSHAGLETRRFPWLVQSFMLDVCKAMACLQNRPEPIVHKDLAIDNVLITADFRAKLSDFGLSKSLNSLTTQNTLDLELRMGFERRPPELMRDPLRSPDMYIDRFLFGICLCEALICASLRQRASAAGGADDYKRMVMAGELADRLARLVDSECFDAYPASLRSPPEEFSQLRVHLTQLMRSMLAVEPEQRPSFDWAVQQWPWKADQQEALSGLARERSIVQRHSQPQAQQPGQIRIGRASIAASLADAVGVVAGTAGEGGQQRLDSGVLTVSSSGHSLAPMISIGSVLGNVYHYQPRAGESFQFSPLLDLNPPELAAPQELLRQLAGCDALNKDWTKLLLGLKLPQSLEDDLIEEGQSDEEAALTVLTKAEATAEGLTLRRLCNALKALNCHDALVLMKPYANAKP